jgi:hypothetical protein
MATLGVFRDEYYNAIHILPAAQSGAGPTATGVVPAALLAGALDCALSLGGTTQTFTTDTAVNIIAQLSNAINTAYKANVGGFASSLAGSPPVAIPNLFNMSWVVDFNLGNVTTSAIFAGGTGVTMAALAGLTQTAVVAVNTARYVVTVTSPTTLTFTRVQ